MMVTRRHAISRLSSAAIGLTVQTPDACLPKGACPGRRDVDGFTSLCFTDSRNVRHQIYTTGTDGPPVILLHELPGLTDDTFATARQLADVRYNVVVPLLLGQAGERRTLGNIRQVCSREQFDCNEGERTSPHVAWLRELARCARQQWPDGKGVGVIGMCLTGAFPIPMLREPAVVSPVICQPTLPFNRLNPLQAFGWFTDQSALAVDPADLKHARAAHRAPARHPLQGGSQVPEEAFRTAGRRVPRSVLPSGLSRQAPLDARGGFLPGRAAGGAGLLQRPPSHDARRLRAFSRGCRSAAGLK
ncbi:MAG: dienelactone hydrolase family protein [Acidobacteria bacterium]|nr:dienelactone hydrolase family protein [Acidobacteriota bacterium]